MGLGIDGEILAIASISTFAIIAIAFAIFIALTVFGRRLYGRKHSDNIVVHPTNKHPDEGYIELGIPPLSPEGKPWILVLYSTQTPKDDVRKINELLVCGLGQYNLLVETPDTVEPQEVRQEWIEEGLRESQAVLLVCNRQFQEEWRAERSCEGELQVARIVKVSLKLDTTCNQDYGCIHTGDAGGHEGL